MLTRKSVPKLKTVYAVQQEVQALRRALKEKEQELRAMYEAIESAGVKEENGHEFIIKTIEVRNISDPQAFINRTNEWRALSVSISKAEVLGVLPKVQDLIEVTTRKSYEVRVRIK
jgi:anti-sigma-K factor RskA